MILCAGLGTRLRPLTDELPKPLVPVGDRPLLAHIMQRLLRAGVTHGVLNVHHKSEKILNIIDSLPLLPQVVHEAEILGTAGGIAAARPLFGPGPLVLHNGDILTTPPVAELVARDRGGLCLAVSPRPVGEGSVGLGASDRVVRLRGRIFGHELRGADYIGIAALGARCLESLPERGCLIQDWAIPELEAGRTVDTLVTSVAWTDLGRLEDYVQANLDWLGARPHAVGRGALVAPTVVLDRSVIGAEAQVTGEGLLSECVIWPGARARAPLRGAVVTPGGRSAFLRP
ncbi:MAG TPA: sugar phosphate nucleotidyltransferase [Polyangiaceae bacterium]|nr:sugar phosphate nucleotidyltransferase [Polyangiaceae bacterium]